METKVNEFRGKSIDDTGSKVAIGSWVYGDLFHGQKDAVFIHPFGMVGLIEVDPSTVTQFTGLKDREGNKIYEGDLLSYDNSLDILEEVWWCNDKACYVTDDPNGGQEQIVTILGDHPLNDFEVIGNIFDKDSDCEEDDEHDDY